MVTELKKIYQLKVQLNGIQPPIWRSFLVVNNATLGELHHAIQIVMGWANSHLHQFIANEERYGMLDPVFGMDWDDELQDEEKFRVKDVLKSEGDSMLYEYDFGDCWEHEILLEKVVPYDASSFLPSCIKGERSCPPEDVGGLWGYEDFLEKWTDETHPEHEETKEWDEDYLGPEVFDQRAINKLLKEAFSRL